MVWRGNIGSVIVAGVIAEALVFIAVAKLIGLAPAIALALGTSLLGILVMKRLGSAALDLVRGRSAERLGEGAVADGAQQAAGGLLLVIPGFVTDLAGLLLLSPSGRRWLAQRLGLPIGAGRPPSGPRTIDLSDGDWTRIEESSRR